jgi:hypothetical protein
MRSASRRHAKAAQLVRDWYVKACKEGEGIRLQRDLTDPDR